MRINDGKITPHLDQTQVFNQLDKEHRVVQYGWLMRIDDSYRRRGGE